MQHRDLKAANVMLVVIDGVLTAKIGDFGLSKINSRDTTQRTTKPKGGSTCWRGPELYDRPETGSSPAVPAAKYSEKADVWSFGMVVFEILTTKVRLFPLELFFLFFMHRL